MNGKGNYLGPPGTGVSIRYASNVPVAPEWPGMSGADGMVFAGWAGFANPVGCRSGGGGAAQAGREAAAEPGASPLGVGMLQVIEDGQGVLPGVAGGGGLADRL